MKGRDVTTASMNWHFWEAIRWDLPAVVLVILLLGFCYSLWATQRQEGFNFADIYRDERGKPSAVRMALVGAWVASTWYVMQDMLDGVPTPEIFWAYVLAWAASKPLDKLAEKWTGNVPFGK